MTENEQPFFSLAEHLPALAGGGWRGLLRRSLEGLLAIPECRRLMDRAGRRIDEGEEVFEAYLRELQLDLDAPGVTAAIPKTGSVTVIANHPFGGADPLALAALAVRVRPDMRILGNAELKKLVGLERWLLPLEIMGEGADRRNLGTMRKALEHLRGGGALLVFPAGAVAHWQWELARVADPPWFPHTGRLIQKSGSAVLPVRFLGQNGPVFQLLGACHPLLRSALICRAFLALRRGSISCRAGQLLNPSELPADPRAMTAALRAAVEEVSDHDGN